MPEFGMNSDSSSPNSFLDNYKIRRKIIILEWMRT